MENYYQVLGISQNATSQEIKQAYKIRLKQSNLLNAQEDGLLSSKQYIDLTAAYNALVDQNKKKEYDRILNSILTDSQYRELKKTRVASAGESAVVLPATQMVRQRFRKNLLVYGTAAFGIILIISFGIHEKSKFSSLDLFTTQSSEVATTAATTTGPNPVASTAATPSATTPRPAIASETVTSRGTPVKHQKESQKNVAQISLTRANNKISFPANHASLPKPEHAEKPAPQVATSTAINTPAAITTKNKILAKWGTPHSIIRYNNDDEIWQYATNSVYFHNGQIISRSDSVLLN